MSSPPLDETNLKLFSPDASRGFGLEVAAVLAVPLARHEEREFEDGEHKIRPLENVGGCDVYVVHSLYADAAQKRKRQARATAVLPRCVEERVSSA